MACRDAERNPAMIITRAGKNTTIAASTVTPSTPRPNTSTMIGANATSGTDRSSIATGMKDCSTTGSVTNSAATTSAPAMPTPKPTAASRTVISRSARIAWRAVAAESPVTR